MVDLPIRPAEARTAHQLSLQLRRHPRPVLEIEVIKNGDGGLGVKRGWIEQKYVLGRGTDISKSHNNKKDVST